MERNDEIGELATGFTKMVLRIKEIIKQGILLAAETGKSIEFLNEATKQTGIAANEIANAVHEIAKGANDQAKDITTAVNIISTFSQKIELVTSSSNQIKMLSENIFVQNQQNMNDLSLLESIASESRNTLQATVFAINRLIENLKAISQVLKLIKTIADQTRLLSLNASIEAAKAGENGRGFAVVANEIRKLAIQVKDSTTEIEDFVRKMVEQTKIVQQRTSEFEMLFSKEHHTVNYVTKSFKQMEKLFRDVFCRIQEIDMALREIDTEKSKILSHIENTSAISQQTAASTEEVLAATQQQLATVENVRKIAERLRGLADSLTHHMKIFKI